MKIIQYIQQYVLRLTSKKDQCMVILTYRDVDGVTVKQTFDDVLSVSVYTHARKVKNEKEVFVERNN